MEGVRGDFHGHGGGEGMRGGRGPEGAAGGVEGGYVGGEGHGRRGGRGGHDDEQDFAALMGGENRGGNDRGGYGGRHQDAALTDPFAGLAANEAVNSVGMDGADGMSMPGMDMGGEIPDQHSGTDHLMHSGLMMEGDAAQDFAMNDTDGEYDLSSYISANKYVVQDVTQRVINDNQGLAMNAANGDMNAVNQLEDKIAKELTNVNDIGNIQNPQLREAFLKEARSFGLNDEEIDHLLHSPISETGTGSLIDRNSEISGSLHTVDLSRTRAEDMGNGMYEVHLVSNNGQNNAHDNMDISTFYTQAGSAEEAKHLVNAAAQRGQLDPNGRYNLTDAGMSIMMNNLEALA